MRKLLLLLPIALSGCFYGKVDSIALERIKGRMNTYGYDSLSEEDKAAVTSGLDGVENPHHREHVIRLKGRLRANKRENER